MFIFLYIIIYYLILITDIYIFNYPKCSTHLWSVVLVQKKYLPKFTISQEVYFHTSKCTFHPDLIWHQKWKYMDPCLNLLIIYLCNVLFIEYLYLWMTYQLNIFIHEFPIIDEIFLYPMNVSCLWNVWNDFKFCLH